MWDGMESFTIRVHGMLEIAWNHLGMKVFYVADVNSPCHFRSETETDRAD